MQSKARQDLHTIWKRKSSIHHHLHAVHHAQELFITEINETYMDRILSSCTTLIWHWFNLILLIAKESIQRSSNNQTLTPDIFLNIQWKCTIQSSSWSTTKDLPKPHENCKNWRIRILTSLMMQILIGLFQGSNCRNRCSMINRKMNGSKTSAQQSLNAQKSSTAMWIFNFQQPRSSRILHNSSSTDLHKACIWWLEQGTSKKNDENRWKKLRKVWANLREFEGFSSLDLNLWLLMQNSVTISALYHLLIQLVKHD